MLHRIGPAGLQNVVKADDVAFHVHIGIGDGIADTGLGRQIHHHVEAVFLKAGIDAFPVGNAAPDKGPGGGRMGCRFLFHFLQSPLLDGYVVIVVDIVKAHNLYLFQGLQQFQHQIGADEAGGTGDQDGFSV